MPKSLVIIEFAVFIGGAVWLLFYQARSARRSSEQHQAEAQQRLESGDGGNKPQTPSL